MKNFSRLLIFTNSFRHIVASLSIPFSFHSYSHSCIMSKVFFFFFFAEINFGKHSLDPHRRRLQHYRLLCISFIGLLIHFSRLILISLIYFCKVGALRRSSCADGHSFSLIPTLVIFLSEKVSTSHRHKTKTEKYFINFSSELLFFSFHTHHRPAHDYHLHEIFLCLMWESQI